MIIYLFGATTPTGQAFINLSQQKFPNLKLISFSRDNKNHHYIDFDNPQSFPFNNEEEFLIVSFSPIWKLSIFLKTIYFRKNNILDNLCGIIACSSSSIYTKKYSYNKFDKSLYSKLKSSETIMHQLSEDLKKIIYILEPTMIYGNVGEYKDKNINLIINFLEILPFIVIPSQTGLRQPIHSYQLAAIAIKKINKLSKAKNANKGILKKIPIGGDKKLSFEDMIIYLKKFNSKNKKIRRNFIIKIPNRIYYLLISPLLIISPKLYEALLRLNTNLAGFTKASDILNIKDMCFPIKESDLKNLSKELKL